MIANGSFEEIQTTAWSISGAFGFTSNPGKSILMKDAFTRLESFGEKGIAVSRGIALEMSLDGSHMITELDLPDDLGLNEARILKLITRNSSSARN
jgi:hypothetical protein